MKRKILITILAVFTGAALLAGIQISRFLKEKQSELITALPFKIDEINTAYRLKQLFAGHLERLAFTLVFSDWRIYLDGPVQITRQTNSDIEVHFSPQVEIEPIAEGPRAASGPLQADIKLQLPSDFSGFKTFSASITTKDGAFSWPARGIDLNTPLLQFVYSASSKAFEFDFTAKSLDWSNPASPDDQIVHTDRLHLRSQGIITEFTSDFQMGSTEILWNKSYFDLPAQTLNFNAQVNFAEKNGGFRFSKAQATFGNKVFLSLVPGYNESGFINELQARWKAPRISAPGLHALVQSIAPTETTVLKNFEVTAGTLETQGKAFVHFTADPSGKYHVRSADIGSDSRLQIRNLGFRWPEQGLSLKGLNGKFSQSERGTAEGVLSIDQVAFRRLRGSLKKTGIIFAPVGPGRTELRIGQGKDLPFEVQGVPLRIKAIEAVFDQEENGTVYALNTGLNLGKTNAKALARFFCLPTKNLPKSSLSMDLPEIRLSPEVVEPLGKIRLDLLGGTIELSEMGAFDLLGRVPELDFNLEVKGIQLDQTGAWSGLGEMDGLIQGHAHDVTFQSWLPTRFDMKLEVEPHHRGKVVFSPEAMKNVVRLFAGGDLDYLPGIADWLAFGWPSRVLGGYDVYYAGFKLHSSQGSMILETLDPPEIFEKTGKHFILYGRRFMMPLRTSHYPLVADAAAMSNFVRHMLLQIEQIRSGKTQESDANANEESNPCFPND